MTSRPRQPRVGFASLGCPKNLVDSEVLLGALAKAGFAVCEDFRDADVIVVNTCCFIRDAEKESVAVIREALDLKKQGVCRGVVVTGCLPQRYGPGTADRFPGVDAVLGVAESDRIAAACRFALGDPGTRGGSPTAAIRPATAPCSADVSRLRLTPRHYAYVRVAEGCDHTCAFCIIPQIRGPVRSKPVERVRAEVEELARDGTREICLIAQDTTAYGTDLYRRRALHELIRAVSAVSGIDWIRILYAHPSGVTPELIETMAAVPQVVPYLDMPIQHVTDRMLGIMRRGHGKNHIHRVVDSLRARIPRITLRTTVLLGHPGETDADVDELVSAIEGVRFERLGAFVYSNEAGTRSAGLPGRVPPAEAARRRDRVMQAQQAIAFARNRSRIGETLSAIVDAPPARGRPALGRTEGDAPDVDGTIQIHGKGLAPGRMVRARITGSNGYDLIGRIV